MTTKDPANILTLLQLMDTGEIAATIEEHITVTQVPGESATIQLRNHPLTINPTKYPATEFLTVTLHPTGQLITSGHLVQPASVILPDPALKGQRIPEGSLGIKHAIKWTITDHITNTLCQLHGLNRDYRIHSLVSSVMGHWTKKIPKDTARRIRGYSRYTQMEDAVRDFLDPQSWEAAKNIKGKVLPKRYNRAVTSSRSMADLSTTNPGAASWLISQDKAPVAPTTHPGELVTQVKNRARRAGVDPKYWKTVSRMDPKSMEVLMDRYLPQYAAAIIINACGDLHVSPTPLQAGNAITILCLCKSKSRLITPPCRNEDPMTTRTRVRLRHLIRLILRPDGPQEDITTHWRDFAHITDYAANLMDNDLDITARTFNGLAKAAHRWHQDEQQAIAAARVQQEIDHREGWFHSWNSLIDTTSFPDTAEEGRPPITAVPLTNTPDLLDEGRRMRHCVATYSNRCSAGRSRIFSIRQDDNILATTELSLRGNTWQIAQVRSYKNGEPSPAARQIAKTLLKTYQNLWKQAGREQPRHRSWLQHPNSNETKEHPIPPK